jgi:RND family efflux transporter MFP subunit
MPQQPDLNSLKIDDRARRLGKSGRRLGWFAAGLAGFASLVGLPLVFRSHRPAIEVATPQPAADAGAEASLIASGYVTPRRRATVAAKMTGMVKKIFAEEGLRVSTDQVLAELDCSEPKASLASAIADRDATAATLADLEVQLGNAKRELKRAQQLRAASINTVQALDTALTTHASLSSRVALARKQIRAAAARISVVQQDVNNCTVRSPFDGIVVSRDAQLGEMVSPVSAGGGFTRTGIATVVDMKSIEIEVDVNEASIARIKPGQKTVATLDAYPQWQIPSTVRTVIPTADRQTATVKVRVAFDQLDPRILPDMGVKVAFLNDAAGENKSSDAKVEISKSAVREEAGKKMGFLMSQQSLERRAGSEGTNRGNDVAEGKRLAVKQ